MNLHKAKELDVYKLAFESALELHKISQGWPKAEQYHGLADQIRRASKSICANTVEGLAKFGAAEQRRFLNMALGSAEEVEVWLDFAVKLEYIEPKDHARLVAHYKRIAGMIFGLMKRRTNP
jgi:four helix bundle protein